MERIQLPWMSERYLFLLSYPRVFRFSTIQTNQRPPRHGSSFLSPVSCIRHLSIPSASCTSSPPVPWVMRLSASVPNSNPGTLATFGVVEQNVLIPALRDDPKLKVTAVASMFRRSPLCVASMSRGGGCRPSLLEDGNSIGAHEDTVNIMR